jgi:hypothetical protein
MSPQQFSRVELSAIRTVRQMTARLNQNAGSLNTAIFMRGYSVYPMVLCSAHRWHLLNAALAGLKVQTQPNGCALSPETHFWMSVSLSQRWLVAFPRVGDGC